MLPADEACFAERDASRAYLAQMRAAIVLVGRLTELDLQSAARERLLAVFRDWRRS